VSMDDDRAIAEEGLAIVIGGEVKVEILGLECAGLGCVDVVVFS
jgi:hypothetical protein